jgi:hypothetical protein
MVKVRNSELIAESETIQAIRYEYIEDKSKLKIHNAKTLGVIESKVSKGVEKDLEYVLEKYTNAVSCLEE